MTDLRCNIGTQIQAHQATHAGLWFDKYLAMQPDRNSNNENAKRDFIAEVATIAVPDAYTHFFQAWEQGLHSAQAKTQHARLVSCRLALGLGAESVVETAITLHRTYGVPYIPGSALKGLAASYAHKRLGEEWQKGSDAYKILFGYAEKMAAAGYITFFDALFIPGSTESPLQSDVLTVHHPTYYNQPANPTAPADWDSPTIIPFVSATGTYLIALGGPDLWVDAAFRILNMALVEMGIGAKTSSGYGRMVMDQVCLPKELKSRVASLVIEPVESYELVCRRLLSETPPPGRARGVIGNMPQPKFGFINPAAGGGNVFIHQNQLRVPDRPLRTGQVVEYTPGPGRQKGKTQANDVEILLEAE